MSTPPSGLTESLLACKAKQTSRKPLCFQTPLTPAPSPSMSRRLQSFGRTCLHSISRHKEPSSGPLLPVLSQSKPLRRKPPGITFAKVKSTRSPEKPVLNRQPYKTSHRQPSASSASTASSQPCSFFLDSPKNHHPASSPILSSSSSATTFSSTSSRSSSSIQTPHRQSDLEPLTAIDFLLIDRHDQKQGFVKQVTETNDTFYNNNKLAKKKKVATMHRMSAPVRSCSTLFQPAQHKHKQTHPSILALGEQQRYPSVAFSSLPSSTSSLQFGGQKVASFETPLVMPSRARSVFGMMDLQQKEQKAILVWRNTITELEKQENLYSHRRVPSQLDDKTEIKWLALQRFITNEIYVTEKSYHELLLLIKTRYMIPMLTASRNKDPLVKFNDIPILFNHLITLIDLSEKILAGFTKDPHSPLANVASSIGYQWLQLQDDWTVFLKYAVHYEINTKTIKRACNNLLLLKIEQDGLAKKDTRRMGMADYLIAPIQRVPRYCLLLKDLLRHTSTNDADYQYLVKVVNSMIGLARAMNDAQKLHRRKTTSLS